MRSDRISRKGGGTAFYIRNSLHVEVHDIRACLCPEVDGALVDFPSINLCVLCVYIPPNLSSSTLENLRDDINNIMDNHLNGHPSRNTMIVGDFNHFDVELLCQDLTLKDIVDRPTRGINVLDHILISQELTPYYDKSNLTFESPLGKSDHLSLVLTPDNRLRKYNDVRQYTVYDYRISNLESLSQAAATTDWEAVMNANSTPAIDVDQAWRNLFSTITFLVDSNIPKKTITLTSNDKPWMTPLTKLIINQKWTAYRSGDWARFQHFKLKSRNEIEKAKSLWANKLKSSPNGLWRMTKQLSGKECQSHLQTLISQCNTPGKLAEAVASSIKTGSSSHNFNALLDDDDWTLNITEKDVEKCLLSLPPNKAGGHENIPNKLYGALASHIARPLKAIFDLSVAQRKFPEDWKKGIIVPIPKTQPPVLHKLRIITLLPAPSKIFEKLVLKNMRNQMEPLFGKSQHAFRKDSSTSTALIELIDSATRLQDDPEVTGFALLSLDLSKAFDNVNHHVLLKKISRSLPKGFVNWIANYLSGRSFQVKIQNRLSIERSIYLGVPQGSVLGPALFSMLVGDLAKNSADCFCIQYADDVNMILPLKSSDPVSCKESISNKLVEVSEWCSQNEQELNVTKSKVMTSRATDESVIVTKVRSMKVLGVILNDKLTWDDHITAACRKASQRLHILRTIRPHVDSIELHQIYCALIRTIFEYCSPVFVKLPEKLNKKIRRVEKRAHRLIFGDTVQCSCDLDGLVRRREDLSKRLFLKILFNKHHLLHDRLPSILKYSHRFSNFTCRTNKRQHSFFPFVTLLMNQSFQTLHLHHSIDHNM